MILNDKYRMVTCSNNIDVNCRKYNIICIIVTKFDKSEGKAYKIHI